MKRMKGIWIKDDGINAYLENSKKVASVVGMLTGAGMAFTFLRVSASQLLPPGWANGVGSTLFALTGFAIICYLFDYGFYRTGVQTFSMAFSRQTYKNATLFALMVLAFVTNGFRLYVTYYLSYESREMNADFMVSDAQTENVTASVGLLNKSYDSQISELKAQRNQATKDLENIDDLVKEHFTGPTASATMKLNYKRYKDGTSQYSRNIISRWTRQKVRALESKRDNLNDQIAALTATNASSLVNYTKDASKANQKRQEKVEQREAKAAIMSGLFGVGAIAWVLLISIIQALIGDVNEKDQITVKKIGVTVQDIRDQQKDLYDQFNERLSEQQDKILERLKAQLKDENQRAKKWKKSQAKPKPKNQKKSQAKTAAFDLDFDGDQWVFLGTPRTESYIKNLASKWKARAADYQQKAFAESDPEKQEKYLAKEMENVSKWKTAKSLFDTYGIEYNETETAVTY